MALTWSFQRTPPAARAGVNQLTNGCFEGTHGSQTLPGWTTQAPSGWDVSKKPSNPCVGADGNYAARINDPAQSGFSGPDIDERIWQVVEGQGANLVAEMMAVHHFAYYTDMNIYGGATDAGPWELAWQAFGLADAAVDRWGEDVQHAETALPTAYAYYKVEFAAMYAEQGPAGDEGGVKFTKAYFESY
jgi:hypothetical protein